MPSSTITFEVTDVCSGGGHGTILIKQDDVEIGSYRPDIQLLKTAAEKNDVLEGIKSVALEVIKTANPDTLPELKMLINNITITVGWTS